MFGKLPALPSDDPSKQTKISDIDNYANELKMKLETSIHNARNIINTVKQKRKSMYDRNINKANFEIGDLVYVRVENRKKNQSPYHGPYKIVKRNGVNSIVDINGKHKELHNNILKNT